MKNKNKNYITLQSYWSFVISFEPLLPASNISTEKNIALMSNIGARRARRCLEDQAGIIGWNKNRRWGHTSPPSYEAVC